VTRLLLILSLLFLVWSVYAAGEAALCVNRYSHDPIVFYVTKAEIRGQCFEQSFAPLSWFF